ncbi:MAG TPA: type II secretion system ATPase GspE [Gammaproteobacteria bacterium]
MRSAVLAETPLPERSAAAIAPLQPSTAESLQDRLVQSLIARQRLREDDLPRIRRLQQDTDAPLCSLLLRLGVVGERHLAEALSENLGLALLASDDYPNDPVHPDRLASRFLKSRRILPVAATDVGIVLAMSDPLDSFAARAVSLACACPVTIVVGVASEVDAALERLYGNGRSAMGRIVASIDAADEVRVDDIEHLKDLASEAPIIRLVNLVLQEAVTLGASDIHIEPFERQLKVRYRVDGFLRETEAPPTQSTAAVISRIKLLAKLDIAERRLPQDGRMQLRVQGRELDIRVSTAPTLYGESIVLRLLETGNAAPDFVSLGFTPDVLDALLACLKQPQGILLVTGPTGSGKTTTLYTALTTLNTAERKIITVEDPIEYQLDGVNQIQVKPQVGLTFVNALRSILRQDPDVIMVGEMRDSETARIAVQSALTGHLVLSTLHTNDAAGAVTRLLDMGVEDYLLTSTVSAILAQRLVRRLCPHCRTAYRPTPPVTALLQRECGRVPVPQELYAASGCEHCGDTGYDGRIAVHELLIMTETLRRLVMSHVDAGELAQAAIGAGMRTMREDGFAKAAAGVTSLDEVLRVTQELR